MNTEDWPRWLTLLASASAQLARLDREASEGRAREEKMQGEIDALQDEVRTLDGEIERIKADLARCLAARRPVSKAKGEAA